MTRRVDEVREKVENALEELSENFVDGIELTFIARNPVSETQTMIVTTADSLEEVIDAIRKTAPNG